MVSVYLPYGLMVLSGSKARPHGLAVAWSSLSLPLSLSSLRGLRRRIDYVRGLLAACGQVAPRPGRVYIWGDKLF